MSKELKPCPFCNIIPPRVSNGISCMNPCCPMFEVQTFNRIEKGRALREWNTRPIEDSLRQQLSACKQEIAAMSDANNLYDCFIARGEKIYELEQEAERLKVIEVLYHQECIDHEDTSRTCDRQELEIVALKKVTMFGSLKNDTPVENTIYGRTHEECDECALENVIPQRCRGHVSGPSHCGEFVKKGKTE